MIYFCTKFQKISQSFSGLLSGHKKFIKGNNYIKYVGRVMVLNFCILSNITIYLYQVS